MLLGIVPETMELAVGLSPEVAKSLPDLVERVVDEAAAMSFGSRFHARIPMKHLLPGVLLMSLVSLACRDVDRDLPRPYRSLEVPAARLDSSDAQHRGRVLFLEHCALCHGERGDGHGVRREGLVRLRATSRNPAWRRSTSPRHVFFAIREGIAGTPMPAWTNLSEQDAWDLTAYVLSSGGPR